MPTALGPQNKMFKKKDKNTYAYISTTGTTCEYSNHLSSRSFNLEFGQFAI